MQDAITKARVLIEALPYIRRFSGKTFVIKIGGAALAGGGGADTVEDIVFLQQVGIRPVIVHGGGPLISKAISEAGRETRFIQGYRHTDEETMRIVEKVLIENVNVDIVDAINKAGGRAQGLHRHFRNPLTGIRKRLDDDLGRPIDLGLVGDISAVDVDGIERICNTGVAPVIAPVATGSAGEALNVNADSAGGAIAGALKAEKLVFMSDTHGIRLDPEDETSLASSLSGKEIEVLVRRGIISGGMLPKVKACLEALAGGTKRTHIIDGRLPHSLLLEIFTDRGVGTMILA
ncbi:MAG: acetylglutamate kinase [Planctomycetes bacterium]|nr:acetylglutamate kinase [Planctomycetota bacterium]